LRSTAEYVKQFNGLIELDETDPPNSNSPEILGLSQLKLAEQLFQPRDQSMLFAPRYSEHHVRHLAQIVRSGSLLEPVVVMSFGKRWFVIDGHHRLKAYRAAEFKHPIPVRVEHSRHRGRARVLGAIQASVALNSRDKLQMMPQDKANAAWRLVVISSDDSKPLSKKKISELTGVSPRTVATMRRVRNLLMRQPFATSESLATSYWRYAHIQAKAIEQGREPEQSKWDEDAQIRRLAQNLSKAIPRRTETSVLVGALVALFPYIEDELWTVLEERRASSDAADAQAMGL
jgi:ParB-like chromosome segregation protein Spo0J